MLALLKNGGAAGFGAEPGRIFAFALACGSEWYLSVNQEVPVGTLPGQIPTAVL